jgi:hypothetical protein
MTTEILRNIMYRVAEQQQAADGDKEEGVEEGPERTWSAMTQDERGVSDGSMAAQGNSSNSSQHGYEEQVGEGEEGVGAPVTREARLGDVGLVVMDEVSGRGRFCFW